MVSCEKCHTVLYTTAPFCPRCGCRTCYFAAPSSVAMPEHQDVQYRDKCGKRIQFMPDGIRVFRVHGISHAFDTFIPYRSIQAVCFKKSGWETGFLSIVTAQSGFLIDRSKSIIVSRMITKFDEDESTFLFNSNRKIKEIYDLLCRICSNVSPTQQTAAPKRTGAHVLPHGMARQDYLPKIDLMEGHTFEYFCADLLAGTGFTNVGVTRGSGDQGVDVLAEKDGIRYAIQCKNYASRLSNTPVQEVVAGRAFYKCHVGAVLTNSTFTDSARELARETGILLWDRDCLREMLLAMPDAESLPETYIPQRALAYIDGWDEEDDPYGDDDLATEPDDDVTEELSREFSRQRKRKGPPSWMIVLLPVCEFLALGFGVETAQRVRSIPLLVAGAAVACLAIVLSILMAIKRKKSPSSIVWAVLGCFISTILLFLYAVALFS